MANQLLSTLNPPQRDAVQTRSGPMLVLAGAGTGKTQVVTFRIANLIRYGIDPTRILAVTFTNKAAQEMQGRVRQLLGPRQKDSPEISTFHALCVRVLRRHIGRLGYRPKFSIYATGQQESLARQVLREVSVSNKALKPSELIHIIGNWKNQGVEPAAADSLATTDKEHLAAAAYRRYQRELKARSAVDFDDLLLCTETLFRKHPDVRREEAARFDHLLVDEYQDTNDCQYRIVRTLAASHRNLCVVGDDDQSIYGWRGAEVRHILGFVRDWPEAKVIRLEENYRSTEAILELSNRLIQFNKDRHDKVLRAARPNGEKPRILPFKNEVEEAHEIVEDIRCRLETTAFEPRDFAILFRTNEQPRAFESELRRVELPYVLIGGMSFFDRREVRDTMAYLRVLDDPLEEMSLLRIINVPPRGIGTKTVELLLNVAVQRGQPIWKVLHQPPHDVVPGTAAADAIQRFVRLVEQHRARLTHQPVIVVIRDLLQHVEYQKELKRLYPDPQDQEARWSAVEEVINELAAYYGRKRSCGSLADFLDEVAVKGLDDNPEKENQLRRNAIALMTLHAAKGLEFSQVYMVGMEEGLLPHHRSIAMEGPAIEEERRLCYVGLTRAEDRLTLSLALSRSKWGRPRPSDPSRFLFEIMGVADRPASGAPSRHRINTTDRRPTPRGGAPAGHPAAPESRPGQRGRRSSSEGGV